jgi:predicted DNA-binding transcriptional regulator AlpA
MSRSETRDIAALAKGNFMIKKRERTRIGESEAAVDVSSTLQPMAPPPPNPAPPVAIRDKLAWGWDEISALTGVSRRLLERQLSAGKMPHPDVRIGRRVLWRPASIIAWFDSLADQKGG